MNDNHEAIAAIDVRIMTLTQCERSNSITAGEKIEYRTKIDALEKWKMKMVLDQENAES